MNPLLKIARFPNGTLLKTKRPAVYKLLSFVKGHIYPFLANIMLLIIQYKSMTESNEKVPITYFQLSI